MNERRLLAVLLLAAAISGLIVLRVIFTTPVQILLIRFGVVRNSLTKIGFRDIESQVVRNVLQTKQRLVEKPINLTTKKMPQLRRRN